jgi:hypothetical protein
MSKIIETKYNGYKFRSRIEARWAVFFDHSRILYEYEKEGYDLSELGRYLPDFWLRNVGFAGGPNGMFIEVKSNPPTDIELKKLDRLSTELNTRSGFVLQVENELLGGNVGVGRGFYQKNMVFTKCHNCGEISFEWGGLTFLVCHVCNTQYLLYDGIRHKDILKAIEIAKSARFENF